MTKIEWATWLGAVGSILVATSAVGIALRGEHKTSERDGLRHWGQQRDQVLRDLDDTRRLVLALMLTPPSSHSPELSATVINALAHHSRIRTVQEIVRLLANLRTNRSPQVLAQLQAVVDNLTERENMVRGLTPLSRLDP